MERIMKIEIDLPSKLNGIKLKDYQDFLEFIKTTDDQQVIQLKMIELFCNFDSKAISKIKATSLVDITNHINSIFEEERVLTKVFKMGNKEFGFMTNLEDMTLGEYIDLDNYLGDFNTIHKAMAVLYRPITKKKRAWFNRKEVQYSIEEYNGTSETSELMKHMPLDIALGAHFFFVNLREELLKATMDFLEQEILKNQSKALTKQQTLDKNGDGIVQSINLQMEMLKELKKLQNLTYTNALPI